MNFRFKSAGDAPGNEQKGDLLIDRSKRYDVYVNEHPGLIVFRNVKILGKCQLYEDGAAYDVFNKFIELEQEDGSRVFVSRTGMVRLCAHGTVVKAENVKTTP